MAGLVVLTWVIIIATVFLIARGGYSVWWLLLLVLVVPFILTAKTYFLSPEIQMNCSNPEADC